MRTWKQCHRVLSGIPTCNTRDDERQFPHPRDIFNLFILSVTAYSPLRLGSGYVSVNSGDCISCQFQDRVSEGDMRFEV